MTDMIELGITHSSVDMVHPFVIHFLYTMVTTSAVLTLLWGSHIHHGMIPAGTLYMMVRGGSQPVMVSRWERIRRRPTSWNILVLHRATRYTFRAAENEKMVGA